MFPRRYFAGRAFAPRFFPQSQGIAAVDAPISATRLYTQAGLTATTGSAAAFTATCRTERAISASTGVETP